MDTYGLKGDSAFMRELRSLAGQNLHDVRGYTDAQLFDLLQVERYANEFWQRKATLLFDGEYLHWNEAGHSRKWQAWSGRKGYWSPVFQDLRDKGPIPAGFYEVRQNEFMRWEDTAFFNRAACILNIVKIKWGRWPGCTPAWGRQRVGLIPKPMTDTRSRSGFTIHGGTTPGSAGCVDLTSNMSAFADEFTVFGKDLLLEVRYKYLSAGAGYHHSQLERP
ncbi:DUF2778 domain-containing protein [Amantichitinum ursilacus]|uniref:L,D-transpeptidase catalytic domain n=1 Tax=Amantichitinum ursilacus TaxID=857265 RepID=A0A0N0GM32_9NEIS|nr:DUF2778 domain-containing protein [Amantichitinum ursilacus]KPC50686.1 hypothetical protein WG78_16570 [Amantichitinum ursilacus]